MRGTTISAIRPYALARLALPLVGGVLALLAPLLGARAQAPDAAAGPTRILSFNTPPLADAQLPEGGVVLALVKASLGRSKAGPAPKVSVRWTSGSLRQEDLRDARLDLFLPVQTADCDRPNELTRTSAMVCDQAIYSEPILQVVLGLFSLTTGTFSFDTDAAILGKTVCIWREDDLSVLNANGRNWVSYKRVAVLRRTSLLDCVVAVQAHDADAFAAVDLEGAYLLRRLGLAPYFTMHPRPLATRGVHAVVWREHPRASEILDGLNSGLKQLKDGGIYASLVQKHLMAAEAPPVARPTVKEPPPPPKVALAPTTSKPAPPELKEVTAPPKAAASAEAAPVPALDPASRTIALRFLKRGDEELAEGRVAPARLLYERAAEMGLAQAAMALAGTYDAAELAAPHLRNVQPDPVQAKRWYERAKALGAAEAAGRLGQLSSTTK